MEVESDTSMEATTTTLAETAEPEVGLVSNDTDFRLPSKSAVESDAIRGDCTATETAINNDCMLVDIDSQTVSLSAAPDVNTVESTGRSTDDHGQSLAAGASSDLQRGSSFDSSTQWSSSASVDTVQSVRHVSKPHPASPSLPEDDNSAAITTATTKTTTITDEGKQQKDNKVNSSAEVIKEPSSNSQQQESQPQQQHEPLPKEGDIHVQDFKAGITCTDVPTAIDVLNTRYRLADVTIHKNMITWSSWNVADIVRGPHRDSFWWRGRRIQRISTQQQNDTHDNCEYPDDEERIAQHDVEELCSKIEHREREIALILDNMDRQAADDVITPQTAQRQQQTRPTADISQQQSASPSHSDKHGNVFQRLMRALRRRFARQQQQQQQQQKTPNQQRQNQQAIQSRQRTL